jgi:Tfp pilus assembly protein PilF
VPSSGGATQGGKVVQAAPSKTASNDPISLNSVAKPGVDLYVAFARLYEENGRLAEAEQQYKKGLKESPKDLRALLGYARLKDRLGQNEEAVKLYGQAVKAHGDEPSVYNNLAVHYAHQGMLPQAANAMRYAIRLRPREVKYRNNIATVLIQLGRPQEAFVQLCAVHDEAVAHYDLGFLMVRDGQPQAAAHQFSLALRLNPSLAQARQWLDRLNGRLIAVQGPPMIGPSPPSPSAPRSNPQQEPQVAARTPPPSADVPWSAEAPPVVVRPADARPDQSQGSQTPEPADSQRLPPVAEGPSATLEWPRSAEPPREDPRAQLAPLPPDSQNR